MSHQHIREPGGPGADLLWGSWWREGVFHLQYQDEVGGIKQEAQEENANQSGGKLGIGRVICPLDNKQENSSNK